MSYSITLKKMQLNSVQEGHTIKEISIKLNITKIPSGWLNTLILNKQAQQKLQKENYSIIIKSHKVATKRLIEKEKLKIKHECIEKSNSI